MDLYTRTAMTSTRHSDLVREADNARLVANVDAISRFDALRRPVLSLRHRFAGLAVGDPKTAVTAHQHR
jgi:hypothetical protein